MKDLKDLLEYQSDRIEAVFARCRIPARVTGGTVTPRWIRFQVTPALGTRIGAITGLAEELAAALDVPTVRVAWQGAAIAVEVPRDDPYPVLLRPLLEGLHNIPPVTAVLGIADDGVPLLIRLPSPDVAHILVTGPAGCGKSALLRTIAISILHFTPALGVVLSPAPRDLARFVAIRQRRRETWPPVVALYDGLPLPPLDGLETVLGEGQKWSTYVILATRHTDSLGRLASLFPVRIESAGAPGDFMVYSREGQHRFWAAWLDDRDLGQAWKQAGRLIKNGVPDHQ